ncbi:LysR family transcriptional regulator [Hyphomicrobium sp. xq]|uniref:LysR family transcriptional regulator n=1 Tax=Hyphomicrobium album TaxID=2665159 RepID=A0A6I3KK61_9HYPH|nr:LysR family transcriptional regulator [Hyphomicrobium album]
MRGTQFAQLTAFVAVAEHRSFTRAAEHLGLSTPSLSQAIRALEDGFGVRLLNRTTRSVSLTEAGEELLAHLNPVLEGVDNAIDAVNAYRDTPSGTIRLTVHPVAGATVLAPLVARFAAAYPAIELEVSVDLACRDLVGGHFDAGIHLGSSIAQDMIAVPIGGKLRVLTVASPEYLARHKPPATPDDLGQHNCVRYRWDKDVANAWRFMKGGERAEVVVEGTLTVNDYDLALRSALDGIGIAQLPEASIATHLAEGRLVPLLLDWSPDWAGFFLFYPSRRHVPVKLRALVDFLRKGAKPEPGIDPAVHQ